MFVFRPYLVLFPTASVKNINDELSHAEYNETILLDRREINGIPGVPTFQRSNVIRIVKNNAKDYT